MALELQPTYSDLTRQQIEEWLEGVRARRMVAAVEFHAGQRLKLQAESDKVQRQVKQQYAMLEKEIQRMQALDDKIQDRLVRIEAIRQELGVIEEQMETE